MFFHSLLCDSMQVNLVLRELICEMGMMTRLRIVVRIKLNNRTFSNDVCSPRGHRILYQEVDRAIE